VRVGIVASYPTSTKRVCYVSRIMHMKSRTASARTAYIEAEETRASLRTHYAKVMLRHIHLCKLYGAQPKLRNLQHQSSLSRHVPHPSPPRWPLGLERPSHRPVCPCMPSPTPPLTSTVSPLCVSSPAKSNRRQSGRKRAPQQSFPTLSASNSRFIMGKSTMMLS